MSESLGHGYTARLIPKYREGEGDLPEDTYVIVTDDTGCVVNVEEVPMVTSEGGTDPIARVTQALTELGLTSLSEAMHLDRIWVVTESPLPPRRE